MNRNLSGILWMTIVLALAGLTNCGGGARSPTPGWRSGGYSEGPAVSATSGAETRSEPPTAAYEMSEEGRDYEASAEVVVPSVPREPSTAAPSVPSEPYPPPYAPEAQTRTLLTAAAVADADRRDNYLNYISRHPNEHFWTGLDMTRRVRIHVVDEQGRPVHDARVRVESPEGRSVGRTHADGIWDYFPSVDSPTGFGTGDVHVTLDEQTSTSATIELPRRGDGQDLVFRIANAESRLPGVLDLGFAIDVTGSMEDELRYVNAEVGTIVHRIRAAAPNTTIRVGAVFYRDRFDSVPVAHIPFTPDVPRFAAAMQAIRADGGGDWPEDLNRGLESAFHTLAWSTDNAARVLVLIADAPPQRYADAQFTYHDALRQASARGIRILPVAASGADRTVEALFRAMGAYTSTPYVYLTDDSGIGHAHMEADTDRVGIELFANLLTRMVIDDLRGRGMHERGELGPHPQATVSLQQAGPSLQQATLARVHP